MRVITANEYATASKLIFQRMYERFIISSIVSMTNMDSIKVVTKCVNRFVNVFAQPLRSFHESQTMKRFFPSSGAVMNNDIRLTGLVEMIIGFGDFHAKASEYKRKLTQWIVLFRRLLKVLPKSLKV